MAANDDRITIKNPNTGRDDTRILRSMYDPVRSAILDAIRDAGTMPFQDLAGEGQRRTPPEMWESASVGWYTTTVKLDLEARGEIERVPRSSPQMLRIAGGP